jgi:hypothetical protein
LTVAGAEYHVALEYSNVLLGVEVLSTASEALAICIVLDTRGLLWTDTKHWLTLDPAVWVLDIGLLHIVADGFGFLSLFIPVVGRRA